MVENKVPATGVLPTNDQLVLGDTHKNLANLAKDFPEFSDGLLSLRDSLDHVFQIAYRLGEDIGLNPQNAIPKRAVPDMEAQRNKEQEKSIARKERDLSSKGSFVDTLAGAELGDSIFKG